MRLVVIGANGRTGAAVVQQARLRGEDVVALARRPEKLSCVAAGAGNRSTGALVARRADLLTGEGVAESLAGVDAVVSAVGIGASRQPTRLYSNGTANLLEAMHAAGVPRLAVVSAAPVGSRGQHPPGNGVCNSIAIYWRVDVSTVGGMLEAGPGKAPKRAQRMGSL